MKKITCFSKIIMTMAILLSSVIAFAQTFEISNSIIVYPTSENNEIATDNTENIAVGLYFWKLGNETGKWIKSR